MSTHERDLRTLLRERRATGRALLLDGATGTELERRGVPSRLPLWSTHALLERPEEVEAVHRSYCAAGAEVLTANTFRTQRRTLQRAAGTGDPLQRGLGARDGELTRLAVDLARAAARAHAERAPAAPGPAAAPRHGSSPRAPFVLGSAPPLEDCYRPDLVPDDAALRREHARHAENLAAAGADGILAETIGTLRELRAVVEAARATGLPVWTSVIAAGRPSGSGPHDRAQDAVPRLLSGEPLALAVGLAAELGAEAVLVNCLPCGEVAGCLGALRAAELPFGAYPNQGAPMPADDPSDAVPGFDRAVTPDAFANAARSWIAHGATIIGGCCGTEPAHLSALAEAVR